MNRLIALLLLAATLVPAGATFAADATATKTEKAAEKPVEQTSVTHHTARIDGHTIRYTATAGTLFLRDDKGQPTASIFYVAYTRDGVDNTDKRPITFAFNGGPGSSAVWLQMGALGPRRVSFKDGIQPPAAPYKLEDNAYSILDKTDIVFIDPVGTGYSRALGDAKPKDFQGVEEDVKSVGEFVRLYTTRAKRWNSPKYLAGESYGTTRAAALVNYMQANKGMYFNGVILISSILNFETASFETGNDLAYITYLPTYAATAWYHKAIQPRPKDLEAFLQQARDFAAGEYAQALMKGSKLGDAERNAVAEKLAHFTGLSADYIKKSNLRVNIFRFTKELLRDQRRTVGRLDSRYLGIDHDAAGEMFEHDPSYTAIMGPYTAVMNKYLHGELKFDENREYEILSGKVNRNWNWEVKGHRGYVNVAEDLRKAMSTNTHLQLFVANGYYDLATPFFATEYTMDHLGLEPSLRDHITLTYYPSGHMVYLNEPSLAQLKKNIAAFIDRSDNL
ncbi:MAG: peptidase S10 [Gammaproteobacteria bacterium]